MRFDLFICREVSKKSTTINYVYKIYPVVDQQIIAHLPMISIKTTLETQSKVVMVNRKRLTNGKCVLNNVINVMTCSDRLFFDLKQKHDVKFSSEKNSIL